jgi:hypothetical protein
MSSQAGIVPPESHSVMPCRIYRPVGDYMEAGQKSGFGQPKAGKKPSSQFINVIRGGRPSLCRHEDGAPDIWSCRFASCSNGSDERGNDGRAATI